MMDIYVATALSVRARACHASIRVSQAEITLAAAVSMSTSSWNESKALENQVEPIEQGALDCQLSDKCSFTLRPAARALLPDQDLFLSPAHDDKALQRLRNILQQSTISTTTAKTIQDIVRMSKEARSFLLQLTPCRLTRAAFQERCNGDPLADILYKLVREAVAQYRDYEDYFADFRQDKVVSGLTPPPFPNYDHDDELDELSYKFCRAESSISQIHKTSSFPVPAGYSCECVGILCHALEAQVSSPIGINLLTLPANHELCP
jgi:hypothetical protein